jgi:hypothetical protein
VQHDSCRYLLSMLAVLRRHACSCFCKSVAAVPADKQHSSSLQHNWRACPCTHLACGAVLGHHLRKEAIVLGAVRTLMVAAGAEWQPVQELVSQQQPPVQTLS